MRRPPEALGQVMALLRSRSRLSQRELSRLSEVSYTQISDLERGQGGSPSPLTLRAIARGLASDDFEPTGVNPVRADAFYRQLMEAAGYLGGVPVDQAPKKTDADDVILYLTARTGDTAVSERLLRLAEYYPDLAVEDQMVVRRLLDVWTKAEQPGPTDGRLTRSI
jgi:transcriptional regulator with XRE-family HTH domain